MKNIDENTLIIIANKDVYYNLISEFTTQKFELIDINKKNFEKNKIKVTKDIVKELIANNEKLKLNGFELPYLTINTIFNNLTSVVYNTILAPSKTASQTKLIAAG